MNDVILAALVAICAYGLVMFVVFPFFRLLSRTVVQRVANWSLNVQLELATQGKTVAPELLKMGSFHRGFGWVVTSFIGVIIVAVVAAPFAPKSKNHSVDPAKAYFAGQVIRCYGMNDFELVANASLCKDAARRVRGW